MSGRPEYHVTGPLDCGVELDTTKLKGKVAIVTGGASGIGEGFVRALVDHGALVCVGDLNTKAGTALEKELNGVKFVQCDVTKWEDQVHLFTEAASLSSSGRISYVVANAGMTKLDTIYGTAETASQTIPPKPDLQILHVDIFGAMYTTKLALHHFVRQNGVEPSPEQEDCCLVLLGSGASFLDVARTPEYLASKWAMRGAMHALRRTAPYCGSRVNMIAPWYVRTSILSQEQFEAVRKAGVEFATVEDLGKCLLRILSDPTVNGRSLFVTSHKWAPHGFVDLDIDDYHDNPLLEEMQQDQLKSPPLSLGYFLP